MHRFEPRPEKGYLIDKFVKPKYAMIKCADIEDATHLKMNGGKWRIPDNLYEEFLLKYSQDIGSESQHCLAEVATAAFPFFIDLDVLDPKLELEDAESDEMQQEMANWCMCATRSVNDCLDGTDNDSSTHSGSDSDSSDNESGYSSTRTVISKAIQMRDRLPSSTTVIMQAPSRTKTTNGVTGTKIGIHIIWPNLLVTNSTARRLRNLVVVELYNGFPRRDWEKIVDLAVYHKMTSLRMIGSFKVKYCKVCSVSSAKSARKREAKLRKDVIEVLDLSESTAESTAYTGALAAVKTEKKVKRKEKLTTYIQNYKQCKFNCSSCNGLTRIPDTDGGVYSVKAVIDGHGNRLQKESELGRQNAFAAVYFCSVRRPNGTEVTDIHFPKGAPIAPRMRKQKPAKRAATDGDDDDDADDSSSSIESDLGEKLEPDLKEPPNQGKFIRAECIGDERDCALAVQNWIQTGVFSKEYAGLQIAQLYRLISRAKSDQNKMGYGGADYILIATVRGFGSLYCCNVRREHTSNHIYFEFYSNGKAVQKCHSRNDAGCSKACTKKVDIPAEVYVKLFPFSQKTMNVLPEEISKWISGETEMEWMGQYDELFCPFPRKAGPFINNVRIGRQAEMMNYRTEQLESGGILGSKRKSSDGNDDDDDQDEHQQHAEEFNEDFA